MERVARSRRLQEYGLAVCAVAVAGVLRVLLQPALGHEYEFTTLFLAVVLAAWKGGFGPAVLALTLDCIVAALMHGFPHGTVFPESPGDSVGLFLYIIMGVGVGVLGESQRRVAASLQTESERREHTIQQLAVEVSRREEVQTELQKSQSQLIQLNATLEDKVKERTNELTSALQELEDFTYSIAHDMRAPLRAVNTTCKLMVDEHGDSIDATGRGLIDSAMRAANFMNAFVDDLLDYARLARVPIKKSKLELTWIVEALGTEIQRQDPSVEITVQPDMEIVSDPYLTDTLFRELLDNACKFKKPASRCSVQIEMHRQVDADEIVARDDGIGFDMEYVPKIFEPFQKLHRGAVYPGTGIGLAKAKRIVERLGGVIWAESSPGEGCAIHMMFPRRLQYEARAADAEAQGALSELSV